MMIEIPGNPIPKKRARHAVRGSYVTTYDPQQKDKDTTIAFLKTKKTDTFGDAYCVTFKFEMPYPSCNTEAHNLISWGIIQKPCNKDIDNLVKFYLDCANGILFPDDRMVVNLSASKTYSKKPRTLIHITSMEKNTVSECAEAILSQISSDEFKEFCDDVHELSFLLNASKENLEMIAYGLSKFADFHTNKLKKITKKCPGVWKQIIPIMPVSMEGKLLC